MSNIRTQLLQANKSSDDRLLEQEGIVSDHGNLTLLGRKVQADLIFAGGNGDKQSIVDAVNSLYEDTEVTED